MEEKKIIPKDVETKGYSANQSVDIRKGYNSQMTTTVRNEPSFTGGYNPQQVTKTANDDTGMDVMIDDMGYNPQQVTKTANEPLSQQTNQGNRISKKIEDTK
ncbi:MAG: hypothetical protein DRN66_00450 [Candidatus Nanohalarchaeota archaeon]|nr:MAG: hypothetical protein DRN66_00450 [Candidatus Nanohaloarchaeota archaeon]